MWQEDIGSLKNPKKSPGEKSFNGAVKKCADARLD
jgi:hypothetical protein